MSKLINAVVDNICMLRRFFSQLFCYIVYVQKYMYEIKRSSYFCLEYSYLKIWWLIKKTLPRSAASFMHVYATSAGVVIPLQLLQIYIVSR